MEPLLDGDDFLEKYHKNNHLITFKEDIDENNKSHYDRFMD